MSRSPKPRNESLHQPHFQLRRGHSLVWLALQANAAQTNAIINWTGDAGYQARLSLTYDDSFASVSASGVLNGGLRNLGINQLSVSFYDPSLQPLLSTVNIANGVVVYDWLAIGFDTSSRTLTGVLDVGKDLAQLGDLYLIGSVDSPSSIRLVDVPTGTHLDTGGSFTVTIVPEPSIYSFVAIIFGGIAVCRMLRFT